ncbi:Thioredoxin reductase [Astathelohania contejeani]|uniref:Thioredoxin reductase n=1 Tax=Astathelohania contejeani TaxID=164912 RepID=A0ABQ7HVC7_9MICR|nr:Thioredoxin reductase [Thelohania contejeani]
MELHNIIIVGSGPAAYTAALYTADLNPILFEGKVIGNNGPGGQLTTTTNVDNYPGFPEGVMGPELMNKMKCQAKNRGVIVLPKTVSKIVKENGTFLVYSDDEEYKTKVVIIASGAQARRLFVPGTNNGEYWQRGISSCAVCDGWAFRDQVVAVIGGGDTAMEETMHLSAIAKKVILIHRRDAFRAKQAFLKLVEGKENVEIMRSFQLKSAEGKDGYLSKINLLNLKTNEIVSLDVDGLFFAVGHDPNTKFLDKEMVKCDDSGYIITDNNMQTSCDGIFACGDVQDKKYRQAVTAAMSGCIAGLNAKKYIEKCCESK